MDLSHIPSGIEVESTTKGQMQRNNLLDGTCWARWPWRVCQTRVYEGTVAGDRTRGRLHLRIGNTQFDTSRLPRLSRNSCDLAALTIC